MSQAAGSSTRQPHSTIVVHQSYDEYSVDIARANYGQSHMNNTEVHEDGWLGNPYKVGEDGDREEVVAKFTQDFLDRIQEDKEFRHAVAELKGERLGCWCQKAHAEGPLCHGEVIKATIEKLHN